ncbi:MAG: response regulator [Alphaproteobacteria bacterium]|nr:response regulator [Alphaproteobacteria bacterium]
MTEPAEPIAILVVDDEASLLEDLAAFLAWHSMSVTSAGGSDEALVLLAGNPAITVVLTDIRMAGLDGLGLAERILADRRDADAVEVVLMTGDGNIDTAMQAVRTGVFDFMRKPMRPDDLRSVVRRAHAKAAARRQAEARRLTELVQLRTDYAALQERLAGSAPALGLGGDTPPELAHILSHELRTPLVTLLALPDMLGTGQALPAGVLSSYLTDVRQAGARLVEVANDLVEFLAPPSPANFAWRVVPAGSMLDGVRQRILALAEARHVGIDIDAGDAAEVETMTSHLIGAVSRLAANAITATPAGGRIRLTAEALADGMIAFGVHDDGRGMSAEEIVLARMPFRQLDMSLARRSGGMGLGLTLAERMAQSLGGRLELTSAPGAGTTARIVQPRRRAAAAP